ncbi:MAG: YchJ family metal-binding protein [Anaerolineae bacterium]
MKSLPHSLCPCHSGKPYKTCCQPLHKGAAAATPEALMRSRYSAYALNLADYIIQTTHPDGEHYQADRAAWTREVELFCKNTRFEGLHIMAAHADMVTFRATLFANQRNVSFTEISLFRRHNGRWTYFSGTPVGR